MSTVETVRGPVDVAELGPTLMHEHIFVADLAAIQKARRLREGRIRTLVDNPRRFFSRAG